MTLTTQYTSSARWDIYEYAEYFESRSASVADRFREAVEKTVRMLCDSPELGLRLRADPDRTYPLSDHFGLSEPPDFLPSCGHGS